MRSANHGFERTLQRARRRYEWARLRGALVGFLPVGVLVGVASALSARPFWSLAFGVGLVLVGVTVLWYGRAPRRAILPGVVAGALPLVLVTMAHYVPHTCGGSSCTSVCLAASLVGGVLAGLVVGHGKSLEHLGVVSWVVASSMALLMGAMACARVGGAGIAGLTLGFVVGVVLGVVHRWFGLR